MVPLVVTQALLIAAIMWFQNISTVANNGIKSSRVKITENDLKQNLENLFYDPRVCTSLFKNKNIQAAFVPNMYKDRKYDHGASFFPANPVNVTIEGRSMQLRPTATEPIVRSNSGFVIKNIKFKRILEGLFRHNVRRDSLSSAHPYLEVGLGEIIVYIERNHLKKQELKKKKKLFFNVMFYYDPRTPNRKLHSCFSPYSDAALCTMSGGTYNSDIGVSPEYTCEPDVSCYIGKQGFTSNPSSCVAPFSASRIKGNPALYLCEWCNRKPVHP